MLSFKFAASALPILLFVAAASGRDAVTSEIFDLRKANRIAVGPGRISILVFPEAVAEAKVGAPDRLKVIGSTTDPRELTIFWVEAGTFETNLIVRTVRRTFIFDIVPSLSKHQDLVRVRGAFISGNSRMRTLESQSLSPAKGN